MSESEGIRLIRNDVSLSRMLLALVWAGSRKQRVVKGESCFVCPPISPRI